MGVIENIRQHKQARIKLSDTKLFIRAGYKNGRYSRLAIYKLIPGLWFSVPAGSPIWEQNGTFISAMEEELEKVEAALTQGREQRDSTEDMEVKSETLLNHCKYFVEHLEDLLLGGTNPIQNAAFFGLVFDSVPTYDELKSGTPDLAPLFKLNEEFTTSKSEVVSRLGLEPRTKSLKGFCSAN